MCLPTKYCIRGKLILKKIQKAKKKKLLGIKKKRRIVRRKDSNLVSPEKAGGTTKSNDI